MKANAGTDKLETKFENEFSDLKDTIQQKMDIIKSQIEKSMTITRQTVNTTARSQNMEQRSLDQGHAAQSATSTFQETSTINRNQADETANKQHLYLGTQSPGYLARRNWLMLVWMFKSKVTQEAISRQSKINRSSSDREFICNTNAFVLHVGTNNISDGNSSENMTDNLLDVIDNYGKTSNSSNSLIIQTPKIIEGSQFKILPINLNSEIDLRNYFLLIQKPNICLQYYLNNSVLTQ